MEHGASPHGWFAIGGRVGAREFLPLQFIEQGASGEKPGRVAYTVAASSLPQSASWIVTSSARLRTLSKDDYHVFSPSPHNVTGV